MTSRAQKIKTGLDAGHPVTGAYNVDDVLAAEQMNAINIDAASGVDAMVKYLIENRSKLGAETQSSSLLGRLKAVAEANVGDSPFLPANNLTSYQIHAAKMVVSLIEQFHLTSVDSTNNEYLAALDALGPPGNVPEGAGVWKQPDVDALVGISTGITSHGAQLGVGGNVLSGEIAQARLLP